ncbi:MAG: hypothetical protein ACK4E7_12855 [Permianibacter sp.]
MKRIAVIFLMCALQLGAVGGLEAMAMDLNMTKSMTYEVMLDDKMFSITSPVVPDREFAQHHPVISLRDNELFKSSGVGVTALKLNWTYKDGLLFKSVSGVLEMRVLAFAARSSVSTPEQLKLGILDGFKSDTVLAKLGYAGGGISFEEIEINKRTWLTYAAPVTGEREYAIALSDDRYLVVSFGLINNTRGQPLVWQEKARALMAQLVASMKLDKKPSAAGTVSEA